MSKEIINRFKREVFQEQESAFYLKMEDDARSLKHCAQFINFFPTKTS